MILGQLRLWTRSVAQRVIMPGFVAFVLELELELVDTICVEKAGTPLDGVNDVACY